VSVPEKKAKRFSSRVKRGNHSQRRRTHVAQAFVAGKRKRWDSTEKRVISKGPCVKEWSEELKKNRSGDANMARKEQQKKRALIPAGNKEVRNPMGAKE